MLLRGWAVYRKFSSASGRRAVLVCATGCCIHFFSARDALARKTRCLISGLAPRDALTNLYNPAARCCGRRGSVVQAQRQIHRALRAAFTIAETIVRTIAEQASLAV